MHLDSSSLYRDILKRAFLVTWHNRVLWILGFFTSFLGLGSIYEITIRKSINNIEIFGLFANKITSISLAGIIVSKNLDQINIGNAAMVLAVMLLSFAMVAFLIWLAIVSFGSIIKSSQMLDERKKKITLLSVIRESRPHFWQLFLVNIFGKAAIFILLALTGGLISFLLADNTAQKALSYFFAFLIFISASLLVTFLIIYASCFIVLKNKKFFESIKNAWKLFLENWVVSIEASVILLVINLIFKMGVIIAAVLLSIPFMAILLIFYSAALAVSNFAVTIIAVWILSCVALMVVAGSFYSAFQIVAWTFIFDRINKGNILSKLHRIFG